NDMISYSENLPIIIDVENVSQLKKYIYHKFGKFSYNKKIYYYYMNEDNSVQRVALTNDSYIRQAQEDALHSIFPIVFLTLLIVSLMIVIWSSVTVKRIERLKVKIDHIDDDQYDHQIDSSKNDEIKSLELAIEDMRISLRNQESYRNQLYQNISHDFKTPLTVMKSYIEALEDEIETLDNALPILKEQTLKLENKVHSLLYLNKLDYVKDMNLIKLEKVNIYELLNQSIQKFKYRNKNLKFKIISSYRSNAIFMGTLDSWEAIIDNILNNAIRYAEKEIRITIKKNQLIFFNDGANIDQDLIEGIFIPFRKGIKGEFGLGLSIVKKTLIMLGYDITVRNHKKRGVSFVITKN
ncbi:MAG: HAMP domain-containing sensor histidine kinase, partial [bacterium]|nr:HAMP domain-containing sensor histidine kinase [bacterium]